MYSYKNARYHDEIRKWNTAQLIEALETNGLGDCCYAIQNREIDGESFLALTEGQLAFWRNTLSKVQIKRLWSYIQLAKERPQDFITNIPQSNPTETINSRKVEKIKSPISNSLNKLLEQQATPGVSQQLETPESNYSNDFHEQVPPRPGVLPPKPNFTRRPVPSPTLRPPIVVPSQSPTYPKPPGVPQHHEEEDFYEQEPTVEAQNDIQPPNFNRRPSANSISRPTFAVSSPSPVTSYPKPPVVQHHDDFYEQKQVVKPQNDVQTPLPPVIRTSNTNRKKVPLPVNYGRPLPSPPKNETPFPLPPNTVPIVRNVKFPPSSEVLPRPPVSFLPPPDIPDFHDHDDEEQEVYDIVDEAQDSQYRLQPWFKDIERKEAARELKGCPNGTFIARPSKQRDYECTFSLIYENKIYNLPVIKENGKLVLGKNYFNTVSEIVEKFLINPLVLNGPNNEDVFVTLRRF